VCIPHINNYVITGEYTMTYSEHFRKNLYAAYRGVKLGKPLMVLFHLLHGIIPCTLTDHHYWNL
jgi:hypothetical protein